MQTHYADRLDEAIRLCDRILVLRNGEIVSEKPSSEVTRDGIISDMTGKPAMFEYARTPEVHDRTVLSLRSVGDGDLIEDITLDVAEGEILGLFGLVGAGAAMLSWLLLSAFYVTLFAADAIAFQYVLTVATFPLLVFFFSRWQQAFLKLD